MTDYIHSLKVFLLGKPYFKEGQPLCSLSQYEKALSGEKWPWSIDKSYGTMHAMCEPEIRSNYVKLPTLQVVINWILLIFGLLSSIVLGLVLLAVFAIAGDFGPRAAALMARKAFSLERLKRQVGLLSHLGAMIHAFDKMPPKCRIVRPEADGCSYILLQWPCTVSSL